MDIENFKIPANKQFPILLDMLTKNIAYTQILEATILQILLKDRLSPEDYQKEIDKMRVRADEQIRVLYQYIYENYGDVGLGDLLNED